MSGTNNQFSLTRAALSSCGRGKQQFPIRLHALGEGARSSTRFRLAAAAALALLAGTGACSAALVTLTNSDAVGASSFNTAGNWSSGAAPAPGNDYFTSTNCLRTPADNNNYTFGGNSLTLGGIPTGDTYGSLLEKSTAAGGTVGRTLTINNLTNAAGALIRSGGNNGASITLTGNVFAVASNSTLQADQCLWIIRSPLVGSAGVTLTNNIIPNSGGGVVNHIVYSNDNSGFQGNFLITGTGSGGTVEFQSARSVPGNPAAAAPGQITLGASTTLLDDVGISLTTPMAGLPWRATPPSTPPAPTAPRSSPRRSPAASA